MSKNIRMQPKLIEWGNDRHNIKPVFQNGMTDPNNSYNHITLPTTRKDGKENQNYSLKVSIVNRGNDNHAPQKDLELGKRSITQKKIAEGLANLVAGKGLEFVVKNASEGVEPTQDELLQIEVAEEFKAQGLEDCLPIFANGLVYQNLASVVISQSMPKLRNGLVAPTPIRFNAKQSHEFRFSAFKMQKDGRMQSDFHCYHETWGYRGYDCEDGSVDVQAVIPIKEYIELSLANKLPKPTSDRPDDIPPAYFVDNMLSEGSKTKPFISHVIGCGQGIFDNAYPLPSWKSNSSINDIQAEFEASCIRIDYLRNGLHVFAIVNVYSASFGETIANDETDTKSNWEDNLAVVQGLRKSYNSGKILINPVQTTDRNKDGKIEIEKIELSFPVDAVRFFNEESRASILTAWGVMADLFSISKPEKNNLRSQKEFLEIGIILLQNKVKAYQAAIEKGINQILEYYGQTAIRSRVIPQDNDAYLVALKDFAKEYMFFNEVREQILGEKPLTDEELTLLAKEKALLSGQLQQLGATVVDEVNPDDLSE